MSITAKQACEACYWLQNSRDKALLAHFAESNPAAQENHIADLERAFARAAKELGFKLVALEGNHLRVVGQ